ALNKTIHVINNGVDLSESVNRSSEQLSELLINKNGYLWVGAIGSLRPVKGYDLLIKAIPNIVTEFPYARFMIVGDGPSRSYLETLATKIDVANYVTFLGRQKKDSSIISKFDIVVVPSRSEGISNVILEAMRAAKPVVATNVGGNSEVILAHKTGILVPPESPEAIAKAVCELLGDANKRKLMGICARKHVQQRFNLQRTVQEYQKVYLKLLQNRI
ncbi:MAG: glycosyltransferase family 1 protein, partial [Calditrichaeota bacterium]